MSKLLGIVFSLAVCVVLGFGTAGCTKKEDKRPTEVKTKVEETKRTENGPGPKKMEEHKKTETTTESKHSEPKVDTTDPVAPKVEKTTETKKTETGPTGKKVEETKKVEEKK